MKLKTLCLATALLSTNACSMAASPMNGEGRILISADAQGIRAWSDLLAGTATNAKASSDAATTPYYDLRQQQNAQRFSKFGIKKEGK